MDNNVFQILLGASKSGGVPPQILRFNWTPSNVFKLDDGNTVYAGYGESGGPYRTMGTVAAINLSSATIQWNRRLYENATQTSPNNSTPIIGLTANGTSIDVNSHGYFGDPPYLFTLNSLTGAVQSSVSSYSIGNSRIGANLVTPAYYVTSDSANSWDYFGINLFHRQGGTSWFLGYQISGGSSNGLYTSNMLISNGYLYISWIYSSSSNPGLYSGVRLDRFSLASGAQTHLRSYDGDLKFLGASADGNHLYVYRPVGWDAGFAHQQTFTIGRLMKIQASNGAVVWAKALRYYYSGGYTSAGTKGGAFDPATEDMYLLTHFRTSNNDGGWTPIWKVDKNGNTQFIHRVSGAQQNIQLDSDNMYLSGGISATDGGFGPGAIFALPKDGTKLGTYGATTYYNAASEYTLADDTVASPSYEGTPTVTVSAVNAPTTLNSSSNVNSAITNGYPIILS